ncbi:MAG: hypothetical protein LPH21_18440 [Shewanella sp.]|nr:hypothetical protein [Shewanella sp.]
MVTWLLPELATPVAGMGKGYNKNPPMPWLHYEVLKEELSDGSIPKNPMDVIVRFERTGSKGVIALVEGAAFDTEAGKILAGFKF